MHHVGLIKRLLCLILAAALVLSLSACRRLIDISQSILPTTQGQTPAEKTGLDSTLPPSTSIMNWLG